MKNKFTVEIKKTPQSIVDAITFFECEFGENYLEYNDIFSDCREIMKFAHEKGYINKEKYDDWLKDWNGNVFQLEETFQAVFGEDEEYEPFCITYHEDKAEDDYNTQYEKALLVYGELICSEDVYFNEFVKEYSSGEGNLCYIQVVKGEGI